MNNSTQEVPPGVIPCEEVPTQEHCSGGEGTTVATEGRSIVVEQGPPWLAELLYAPPDWLVLATQLFLILLVAGLAAGFYYADIEDYGQFAGEVGEELLVVTCVAGGAAVLAETGALPYWMDVLAGCTMGYCVSQAILVGLPRLLSDEPAIANGSKD